VSGSASLTGNHAIINLGKDKECLLGCRQLAVFAMFLYLWFIIGVRLFLARSTATTDSATATTLYSIPLFQPLLCAMASILLKLKSCVWYYINEFLDKRSFYNENSWWREILACFWATFNTNYGAIEASKTVFCAEFYRDSWKLRRDRKHRTHRVEPFYLAIFIKNSAL